VNGQRHDVREGPLTVAQSQLWALDRCTSYASALNLGYALNLTGPLDVTALDEAFTDLVRTHEPLRTTYHATGDGPLARVRDASLALAAVDLTPRPVTGGEDAAALARAERKRGFDLAHEAPVRATLLRLAEDHHVLLLTLHHIAADGWSLYVVNETLSRGYAARLGHTAAEPSPRPRVECLEQAARQRDWLAGEEARREAAWWSDRLRGARPRPARLEAQHDVTGAEMLRHVEPVPDELTTQLRRLGRSAGVSLYAVLLSAFNALLLHWSGEPEPVVGTLVANRPTADSAEVLGAHYNPLLMSTRLDGDPSLAEVLLRTSADTLRVLDRQQLPYAVLAPGLHDVLGWPPGTTPAAMFLMDRYPLERLTLRGCDVTGLYLDDGGTGASGPAAPLPASTTAALNVFVREAADRLTVSVLSPRGTLGAADLATLAQAYLDLLVALCETPEVPLSEVELYRPEDPEAHSPVDGAEPSRPILREVTGLAPVEALSPVGAWSHP